MKTTAWWGSIGLALLVLGAPAVVEARGSVYRGPGGMVPPGLREPTDPTPPPPPPPSGSLAAQVPAPPPLPYDAPSGLTSFEDWPFWYQQNREAFEGSPGPEAPPTPELRGRILEVLAQATRDEGDDLVAAAALIALGRAAERTEHVETLLAALAAARSARRTESAALGLGLLRRSSGHDVFDAALYDRVRDALLAAVKSEHHPARARAFAAVAIGLLGDQPSASATSTTQALLDLARTPHANPDIPIALLHALALQRGEPHDETLAFLRTVARAGALPKSGPSRLVRDHALMALGRTGAADSAEFGRVLEIETDSSLRRSAAMALVQLAIHADVGRSVRAVDLLLRAVATDEDTSMRGFSLAGAAAAVAARPDDAERILSETLLGEMLLTEARYGEGPLQAHAAIGLGHLLRHDAAPFAAKARAALEEGARSGASRTRAAFALSLGLARHYAMARAQGAQVDLLESIASDPKADGELRGYAALGLSHAATVPAPVPGSDGVPLVAPFLRKELAERRTQLHHMLCAVALGVARDPGAVSALKEAVTLTSVPGLPSEAAAALARIGTPAAAEALLALATAPDSAPSLRAVAIAGLGRLLDREPVPSLARFTLWMNYRASTDTTNELLTLL